MKNKNTKLYISLNVLIFSLLISTSAINSSAVQALVEKEHFQYTTNAIDRSLWKWSQPQIVSTESNFGSYNPFTISDDEGNIYCVWEDTTDILGAGGDWDIFFKRWDADTFSWSATEVISTESTDTSTNPFITLDSNGNIYCVWEDETDYLGADIDDDIFFKFWNASSSLWSSTAVVSTESTDVSQNPVMGFDGYGIHYVSWHDETPIRGSGSDTDIFLKRWTSLNNTWGPAYVVSTESNSFSFNPDIIVDPYGNFFITWQDNYNYLGSGTDYDIWFKAWNVTAYDWVPATVISTQSTGFSLNPSMVQDSNYDIHFTWSDLTIYGSAGTDQDIFYRKMHYETSGLSPTEVVSNVSTTDSLYPSLELDFEDNLHLSWQDLENYDGSGIDRDIFYIFKDSMLGKWGVTEVVSTESTAKSSRPSLIVDPSGVVQIIYQDSTNYAGSGNDADIFYKIQSGPPEEPDLAFIVPNPTELDTVKLDWDNVSWVTDYYVYRSTSYIWSVDELDPIATVSSSLFLDTLPSEGYYYYVIVAGNNAGNSTHSNCQYVHHELPHLQEFGLIAGLILGVIVFSLVAIRMRKIKSQ